MPGKQSESVITRNVGPLSLRASFKPETVDTEKRTVELVWTTGARVLRSSWIDGRFWEELSLSKAHVRMDRLKSGRAPLLDSHDSYGGVRSILGVVQSAKISGAEGSAIVRFPKAEDDPEADKIFRKVQDGIIANVSVGYRVHKMEKVEDGADKIPVMRAVDWEPYEISLVSMGADSGAGTRSDESSETNPCDFVTRAEEEHAMPKNSPAASETPIAPETPAPVVQNDDAARTAAEAATKAERERGAAIRLVVRKAKLDEAIAEELVAKGSTIDEARAVVLDKLATADEQVRTEQHTVEVGDDGHAKFMRAAESGMIRRAGLADVMQAAKKTVLGAEALRDVVLDDSTFQRFTFAEIARECLERRGVSTRGMDRHAIIAKALTHRSGGMATASDFAVLLEAVVHKSMLGSYATQPSTWPRFCGQKSVTDFRDHAYYRNGSFGTLDAVSEHGEVHSKAIPDGEKVTLSVLSYGNRIGITRKALVNDDMGAFNDLASRFGAAAANSIEAAVYALLALNAGLGPTQTDSSPFYDDTARGNVGAGAALSVESLDADATKLAYQEDPSGNKKLDLRPAVLLVPRGLEGTARVINDAQYDPSTSNKLQMPNRVRGLFKDIVGSAQLTALSTRRYIFADPAIAPALVVAFLEGQSAPRLESQQGWEIDGIEWRVLHDFGVKAFDYRATVTNAGTG